MNDDASYDPYAMPTDAVQEPPETLWRALRKIGPGIILAGSIVGPGELIATTTLGARWGSMLLWLMLLSCVIKVFVQIELGRVAISSGKPTLVMLNELPGWRFRVNWQVWWWLFMVLATVAQLGAMVGAVGQALNLAMPGLGEWATQLCGGEATLLGRFLTAHPEHPWAVVTGLAAVALLLSGGYLMIERLTTFPVVPITLATVACVVALQWTTTSSTSWTNLATGLAFHFPRCQRAGCRHHSNLCRIQYDGVRAAGCIRIRIGVSKGLRSLPGRVPTSRLGSPRQRLDA